MDLAHLFAAAFAGGIQPGLSAGAIFAYFGKRAQNLAQRLIFLPQVRLSTGQGIGRLAAGGLGLGDLV